MTTDEAPARHSRGAALSRRRVVSGAADAEILEILNGADEALPLYQRAAGQGHRAASLAAGRVLLDRRDSAGIALVEASMDLDEGLVPDGCRILAEYYKATNQLVAARKCEWRATSRTTRIRLAQPRQTS